MIDHRQGFEIDVIGSVTRSPDSEAADVPRLLHFLVIQELQKLGGRIGILQPHRHRMETANSFIGAYAAIGPRCPSILGSFHEYKPVTIGTVKCQALLAEPLLRAHIGDALVSKSLLPTTKRAVWH